MVMVEGCHTDKVYLQPIKEIKFLDDWKEKFEAITEKFETTGDPQDGMTISKLKMLFMSLYIYNYYRRMNKNSILFLNF